MSNRTNQITTFSSHLKSVKEAQEVKMKMELYTERESFSSNSTICNMKEHFAALDTLVYKLKEISLQKEVS